MIGLPNPVWTRLLRKHSRAKNWRPLLSRVPSRQKEERWWMLGCLGSGELLANRAAAMSDDPCRSVRAHARSLEDEVALMRGVVAALRSSSSRKPAAPARHERPPFPTLLTAFLIGVAVGAVTLILLTRSS
jgi:hypothetical protein